VTDNKVCCDDFSSPNAYLIYRKWSHEQSVHVCMYVCAAADAGTKLRGASGQKLSSFKMVYIVANNGKTQYTYVSLSCYH
jgi:hypothetical protein